MGVVVVVNMSQPRLGNQCVFEQMGLSIVCGWEQIGRTMEAGWVCSPVSRNCDGLTEFSRRSTKGSFSVSLYLGKTSAHLPKELQVSHRVVVAVEVAGGEVCCVPLNVTPFNSGRECHKGSAAGQ